ncbi:MAG: TetR/AcrR family transcriptional regulator [Alphaproteobacteria bacterium]|nr:MAG: TetR/AcrR family transcriptional regulator [Alphaproteobacteria bacterium]
MCLNPAERPDAAPRSAIRAAAEALFAENGIDGVTTRTLAERAGVNTAAVNYYFGSKDNLALEVFRDVARRSVRRRLDNLARIEARARAEGRAADLAELVEAFVDAYVNEDSPRSGLLLAHLVLRHRVRPTAWTRAIVREELDGFALRFIAALRRAAPHLDAREVHWRYHLMVGAMIMILSDQMADGRMKRLSEGLCDPADRAQLRRQLIGFLVAAFGAPGNGARPEPAP